MKFSPKNAPQRNNGASPLRSPPPALLAALNGQQPPAQPFWQATPKPSPAALLSPNQQAATSLMQEASVLVRFGQYPPAAQVLQQAAALWPTNTDILYQFGCVLLEIGQPAEALKRFDTALALRPNWSDAWNNKSAAHARIGQVDESITAAHKAIEHGPNIAAMANLCAAYSSMGRHEEALRFGEQAIQLSNGENQMALINYGVALRAVWDLSAAAGAQERAIELTKRDPGRFPPNYMAFSNLGAIRNLQGRNHEALMVTQMASELVPTNPTVRSNMIMFSDLLPETTLLEAYTLRRTWAHLFEEPLKRQWPQHGNDRTPGRKLRVGYVGADFRQHSAAHIHGAIIRAHDPEQVAVYVYAGNKHEDEISAKIREAPALAEWVCTATMSDHDLANRIHADQIDILVDVASFTSGGRLITFALKPAPVQMTAWGYANGTGLDSMDYFIADDVIVPPELEYGYREKVVRMSNLLCFDPFLELPPPGPPPVQQNGYLTFGSYNRVEKISAPILRLWAEVMKQHEGSRMVLKFGGLTGEVANNLYAAFESHGISRDRIECRGHTPRVEHLHQYADIDIMLDSWPHVGGITTLEALWMGVPCVTLLGDRAPSRVSASILTTLGLTDWIAETPAQYLQIVQAQAQTDLTELRASLPGRVRASVIGDTVAYTRELEQVYRQTWQTWLAQSAERVAA